MCNLECYVTNVRRTRVIVELLRCQSLCVLFCSVDPLRCSPQVLGAAKTFLFRLGSAAPEYRVLPRLFVLAFVAQPSSIGCC